MSDTGPAIENKYFDQQFCGKVTRVGAIACAATLVGDVLFLALVDPTAFTLRRGNPETERRRLNLGACCSSRRVGGVDRSFGDKMGVGCWLSLLRSWLRSASRSTLRPSTWAARRAPLWARSSLPMHQWGGWAGGGYQPGCTIDGAGHWPSRQTTDFTTSSVRSPSE
jgi:hypothetical protein